MNHSAGQAWQAWQAGGHEGTAARGLLIAVPELLCMPGRLYRSQQVVNHCSVQTQALSLRPSSRAPFGLLTKRNKPIVV